MGCLMTKNKHVEEMVQQEEWMRCELMEMEAIIGQLRRKLKDKQTKEVQHKVEMLEMKNTLIELRLFNSEIVSLSSHTRQNNADLKCQLNSLKNWQKRKHL